MAEQVQFRDQDLKYIKAKSAGGLIPFVTVGDMSSGSTCTNCGGLKSLVVSFGQRVSQSFETLKQSVHWDDKGNKYIIVAYENFPCPLCGGDHQDRIRRIVEACGVPEHERNWDIHYIDGLPGKEIAHRTAMQILASCPDPAGLYLYYGDYGVGKSGLLKSLTIAMAKAGVQARYINANELLAEMRSTFREGSTHSEIDLLGLYGGIRFLAIDELDVIGSTAWARDELRLLIDKRYESRSVAVTCLGTNQNPDNLWPYLSSRCSDGYRVPMGGASLRGGSAEIARRATSGPREPNGEPMERPERETPGIDW